jgi:hypothetical protein
LCRLQFLLGLASAFILGSEFRGLMTIFYCLRSETPQTWRDRYPYLYPTGTGWPSYTPGTGLPFRRLLRLAELRWRNSKSPLHGGTDSTELLVFVIEPWHGPHRKYRFHYCVFSRCREITCPHSCYLTMGLHVTILN